MDSEPKICVRCNRPVTVYAADYDLFEKMHWLCFHLEFEHQGDPDAPCSDPSCPLWQLEIFKKQLSALGHDPEKIIKKAIEARIIEPL